jgi:hypothetical protein
MMMSDYEVVERRKFQLALVRIVDLEQAILKAARRLENEYVKQLSSSMQRRPPIGVQS